MVELTISRIHQLRTMRKTNSFSPIYCPSMFLSEPSPRLRLNSMLKSGKGSDFTITCNGHLFRVHTAIIRPRSDFFTGACDGDFQVCSDSLNGVSEGSNQPVTKGDKVRFYRSVRARSGSGEEDDTVPLYTGLRQRQCRRLENPKRTPAPAKNEKRNRAMDAELFGRTWAAY